MLHPRGICLFPPLPPIPSFHKASLFTGSTFKIASRRQLGWGGGGGGGAGGVEEEEEKSFALLAFARRFFAPLPDQKTWSQASTKCERPGQRLV